MNVKPFRVVSRIKNNRLILAREQLGYTSARSAASAFGFGYSELVGLETLRESPWNKRTGDWKPFALKVADAYGIHPDELWPDEVSRVQKNVLVAELDANDIRAISGGADVQLPDELMAKDQLRVAVRGALAGLPPRQSIVIRKRFGFEDEDEQTFDEIAATLPRHDGGRETGSFGVTKEVVRQIEAKALRRLKHKHLKDFLP